MSKHKSKYFQKLRGRKQMYGPGKPGSCCANNLEFVEIHNDKVDVPIKGRTKHLDINKVPAKYLPIFTSAKTQRART